jgi:hypothetical protein
MWVYVLQHTHIFAEDDEDVKMIGVYSTREAAEQAVKRLSLQPGFCDNLNGFAIDRYTIDEDNWIEGYATVYGNSDEEQLDEGSISTFSDYMLNHLFDGVSHRKFVYTIRNRSGDKA